MYEISNRKIIERNYVHFKILKMFKKEYFEVKSSNYFVKIKNALRAHERKKLKNSNF